MHCFWKVKTRDITYYVQYTCIHDTVLSNNIRNVHIWLFFLYVTIHILHWSFIQCHMHSVFIEKKKEWWIHIFIDFHVFLSIIIIQIKLKNMISNSKFIKCVWYLLRYNTFITIRIYQILNDVCTFSLIVQIWIYLYDHQYLSKYHVFITISSY